MMRRAAIGVGAAAGASAYGISGGPGSPIGSASALPPEVVAAGTTLVGGPVALGWALREFEIIGKNPPAEGLTEDVLRTQVYEMARKRYSNDKSTFIDNRNLLDGMENTAYTDGKIAAIEKLNQELSQSEVQDAALAAVDNYESTVKMNLLRSHVETFNEFESILNRSSEHPDLNKAELVNITGYTADTFIEYNDPFDRKTITLPDGTEIDVPILQYRRTNDTTTPGNTSEDITTNNSINITVTAKDGTEFFPLGEWSSLYSEIGSTFQNVRDGLAVWVNNIYSEVQSGEIEVSELLTPREQAELLSEDEEYPQAVADLIALNIPVDPDREATISFENREITISGLMAPTSPPADGFVVGQLYDPPAEPWDLYFTYDPSKGSGGWGEFESTISEGIVVFTEKPYPATRYQIPTNAGEVEVTTSDFTESESGGTWTADVSDQLELVETEWTDYNSGIDGGTVTFGSLPEESAEFTITATDGDSETVTDVDFTEIDSSTYEVETELGISEVESVTARIERWSVPDGESVSVYSEDGSVGYETIQISEPFTLEKLEDSDGNTYGEAEFEQSEPQTDENYITQEEWDQLEKQNQELIDKYEQATETDTGAGEAGGGGGFLPGSDQNWGLIAIGAGAIALGWGYITGDDQ